jgi:hypothetical protein
MQVQLTTLSPPTAVFSPQGIQVNGPGQIVVSTMPPMAFLCACSPSTSSFPPMPRFLAPTKGTIIYLFI